jgi:methyltransferase
VGWLYPVVALVALQRFGEIGLARRNTRQLLAAGGVERGARHYPLFIVLHGGWLVALAVVVPSDTAPNLVLLGIFAALQLGRVWVIASLGRYWTTRIITVPGAPLIRHGPYRYMKHPNYLIVIAEIAVLPLAFHAWSLALVFSALNLALLGWRIRVEDAHLDERRRTTDTAQT